MTTTDLIILGSTGSIGTQTLEVVGHLNALIDRGELDRPRYRIVGLAAGRNAELLAQQADRHAVPHLALADPAVPCDRPARRGVEAAAELIDELIPEGARASGGPTPLVVSALNGVAGLRATLLAAHRTADLLLAHKESLVAAGELITRAGCRLHPIDSEHAALRDAIGWDHAAFELPATAANRPGWSRQVRTATLTASGGPFRTWTKDRIAAATPSDALAHPTWAMGAKVTIDSASLTNKALEIIEARWLFDLAPGRLRAIVHPQSIVHALVEFHDGSSLAQLAMPDMRLPIQQALGGPVGLGRAVPGLVERLDLAARAAAAPAEPDGRPAFGLSFEEPDLDRFPSLGMAWEVLERGGTAGAVFNAANEVAVEAFLAGRLAFGQIPELQRAALEDLPVRPIGSLDTVFAADAEARAFTAELIARGRVPA